MNNKTVIVSGGAGYIGSCTAHSLSEAGFNPIILDNFSTSRRPKKPSFPLFEIDLTNLHDLKQVMMKIARPHAIFHFAAKALVSESTHQPWSYFQNNILATLNLAEVATLFDVPYFIHSSTCAVYGTPQSLPMSETDALNPITPYGHSKLAAENILEQFSKWKNLRLLNLRYFNPAGAVPEVGLGEVHDPETHLIPNLVQSFINNQPFQLFGDDYPTKDGTCVRDLIHIRDLTKAHILGLQYLESHSNIKFETINIGSGQGISVKEAIDAAKKALNVKGQIELKPKRDGDPPELIADNSKMKRLLQWTPEFSLEDMIHDHAKFVRLNSL